MALKGGDLGPAILPGNSADSPLIHYVADLVPDLLMPSKGERLSAAQIGLLRAWIDQGADFGDADLKEETPKPVDPKLTALIGAVKSRNQRAAQKLLRANPELAKSTDAGGSTALHHAAAFSTLAVMKQLIDARQSARSRAARLVLSLVSIPSGKARSRRARCRMTLFARERARR